MLRDNEVYDDTTGSIKASSTKAGHGYVAGESLTATSAFRLGACGSLDEPAVACQSRAVKSCGPSGSQDLAFKPTDPIRVIEDPSVGLLGGYDLRRNPRLDVSIEVGVVDEFFPTNVSSFGASQRQDDGDTSFLVVTHRKAPWGSDDDQTYSIAVELVDEARLEVDLYNLVQQRVRIPTRVRARVR